MHVFSAHLFDERPLITFTHCHLHHTATLTSLINQNSQKTDANEKLANKVARSNVDSWLSLSLFVSNVIMHEMYSFMRMKSIAIIYFTLCRSSIILRHVCCPNFWGGISYFFGFKKLFWSSKLLPLLALVITRFDVA